MLTPIIYLLYRNPLKITTSSTKWRLTDTYILSITI